MSRLWWMRFTGVKSARVTAAMGCYGTPTRDGPAGYPAVTGSPWRKASGPLPGTGPVAGDPQRR